MNSRGKKGLVKFYCQVITSAKILHNTILCICMYIQVYYIKCRLLICLITKYIYIKYIIGWNMKQLLADRWMYLTPTNKSLGSVWILLQPPTRLHIICTWAKKENCILICIKTLFNILIIIAFWLWSEI